MEAGTGGVITGVMGGQEDHRLRHLLGAGNGTVTIEMVGQEAGVVVLPRHRLEAIGMVEETIMGREDLLQARSFRPSFRGLLGSFLRLKASTVLFSRSTIS